MTMSQTRTALLSNSVRKLWDLVFKTDPDAWGIFPRFRNGFESQRLEVGSPSYARLNFTDQLATRLVVDKRYGHVGEPEGWI